MAKFDPEFASVAADFSRLFDESFLTLLDQVIAWAGPESPRIAGSEFPSEGDSPKHREDFHVELCEEIEKFEDVGFSPRFNFIGGLLRYGGWDEWTDCGGLCPSGGVDPDRAVSRDAVESESCLRESVADFFWGFEFGSRFKHVVAWLCTLCARALCVRQKVSQRFRAVLGALDGWMVDAMSHGAKLSIDSFCGKREELEAGMELLEDFG